MSALLQAEPLPLSVESSREVIFCCAGGGAAQDELPEEVGGFSVVFLKQIVSLQLEC